MTCRLDLLCNTNGSTLCHPRSGTSRLEELVRHCSTVDLNSGLALLLDGTGFVCDPDNDTKAGARVIRMAQRRDLEALQATRDFVPERAGAGRAAPGAKALGSHPLLHTPGMVAGARRSPRVPEDRGRPGPPSV